MPSEAALTTSFLKKLRLWCPGAFIYKINDRTTAGIPDALVCFKGRAVWVEFKKAPYKVSEIQRLTHLQLGHAGFTVFIVIFEEKQIHVHFGELKTTFTVVDAAIEWLMAMGCEE